MGITDPPSPYAAVALLPWTLPNACDGITTDVSFGAFLLARRALLLPHRVRSQVDTGIPRAAFDDFYCRRHFPQRSDTRNSRRSPPTLACVGDWLVCISYGLFAQSARHQYPTFRNSHCAARAHVGAPAANDQRTAAAASVASGNAHVGGELFCADS